MDRELTLQASSTPSISVLVVTYNRKQMLHKCLSSIAFQTVAPKEVIVFDNSSTDGTPEVVHNHYPSYRLIRSKANLGCPAGRNAGIAEAVGEYVFCVDDDGTLEPDAIAQAQTVLGRRRVAILAGVVNDAYHPPYDRLPPGRVFTFSGGVCVVDRTVFQQLGGYHEDGLRQGEETELAYRLFDQGHEVYRDPAIVLHHHVIDSPERWALLTESTIRQAVLTAFKTFPVPIILPWTAWKTFTHGRRAIQSGNADAFVRGLLAALRALPAAWASREPASYEAVWASTRWGLAGKATDEI